MLKTFFFKIFRFLRAWVVARLGLLQGGNFIENPSFWGCFGRVIQHITP